MGKINLDNWYVKDNVLSISLMRFYVYIDVKSDNNIKLKVTDENQNELNFDFEYLDEAIFFTEYVVNGYKNKEEIIEKYNKMFKKEDKNLKIDLTPSEVEQAILEYYDIDKDDHVRVEEELTIKDGHPDIKFSIIEHIDYIDIDKDLKTYLEEDNLSNALNEYISTYNYELINFKYIGGIHRVGYFFDEDTPHYDGIQLNVKKKEKILKYK